MSAEGLETGTRYWALILPAIGLVADAITILVFLFSSVSAPSTSGSKVPWAAIVLTLLAYSSLAAGFAFNYVAFIRQLGNLKNLTLSRQPKNHRAALVEELHYNINIGVLVVVATLWIPLFLFWFFAFVGFDGPDTAIQIIYGTVFAVPIIYFFSRGLFQMMIGPQKTILAVRLGVIVE
ncbi:hypothetical protein [Bradyrhizobium sp. HKCCYLR20261]|uniref:hypothetical protein n=1 Tax=Bradyrhizobium sp. HKCCYLR20261 TaxID=3420760 RepID=UPI003EB773F7